MGFALCNARYKAAPGVYYTVLRETAHVLSGFLGLYMAVDFNGVQG